MIERKTDGKYILLEIPPQPKSIYVIVRNNFDNTKPGDRNCGGDIHDRSTIARHLEFFYEEHQCPVNFVGDIQEIITDGDGDPHGLFRYCGYVDNSDAVDQDAQKVGNGLDAVDVWSKYFPEFLNSD